jgi:hypothetical protein
MSVPSPQGPNVAAAARPLRQQQRTANEVEKNEKIKHGIYQCQIIVNHDVISYHDGD